MTDQSEPHNIEPSSRMRTGNRALSVMDQIRESILDGSVVTGERLNEVRLSRTLAVSRTPVRAALQALAGEGLLDYEIGCVERDDLMFDPHHRSLPRTARTFRRRAAALT